MSRNMTPLVYGILAILAIGLGLFIASIFGNPAPNTTVPNSVASASVRTSTPAQTAAPTQAAQATSAPTMTATVAATDVAETSQPTAAAPETSVTTDATPAATADSATAAPTAEATQAPVATGEAPTEQAPVAPTEAPTEQPTAGVAYIEYTVQPGDSLKLIAQRYNVTVREILAINDIPNPDSLRVGVVIKVPTF